MLHQSNLVQARKEARRLRDEPLAAALVVAVSQLHHVIKSDPLGWSESPELLDFLRASDALTCTDAHADWIGELESELEARGEEEARLIGMGYTEYDAMRAVGAA